MNRQRRIITDNATFFSTYPQLRNGDLICCRLRLRPGEEHLLVDLAERGIEAFPSFRAQWCCRSKVFQTRLFSWAMVPHTTAVYTINDLLETVAHYERAELAPVVVKLEGKNGGLGVLRYPSIEEIYSQSALGQLRFPFVVQPLIRGAVDIRVLILDDYVEAYRRSNDRCFRQNLHCGGAATPFVLRSEQIELCRRIMEQGGFPYAHLDLLEVDGTTTYFSEINLRGGLRGARIGNADYLRRLAAIHQHFLASSGNEQD